MSASLSLSAVCCEPSSIVTIHSETYRSETCECVTQMEKELEDEKKHEEEVAKEEEEEV